MAPAVQIISGLSPGAKILSILSEELISAGIDIPSRIIKLEDASSIAAIQEDNHLLFVIPILGDNDLTSDLHTLLHRIINLCDCTRRAILIALNGDRHVSDDSLVSDAPICTKLRHLFAGCGVFRLWNQKLDRDTSQAISAEMAALLHSIKLGDVAALTSITKLLNGRPDWEPMIRKLDLYCPQTGFSLLFERNSSIVRLTSQYVAALAPKILFLRGAGLDNESLPDIADALNAKCIDVGNNAFTLGAISQYLINCNWLSLSANQMIFADLSLVPSVTENILLHKNFIGEITLKGSRANQFKLISLYRNCLSYIDWPTDQLAISRLNLGANPIQKLPSALANATHLKWLGLARTQIKELPDWIFHLPNIQEIDVSYIEDILPASQLRKLRMMKISLITRPGYRDAL